jgi:hypothetical protein
VMVCTQGVKWLCNARVSLMDFKMKAENLLLLYDNPFIMSVGKRWHLTIPWRLRPFVNTS